LVNAPNLDILFEYVLSALQIDEDALKQAVANTAGGSEMAGRAMSLAERLELKGLKRGREEGKAQGREQGRQEGRQQGALDAKREMARKLIEKGYDMDAVTEITELPAEEVREL
jgi:predicted transposase/invertase (TIGR01784 family)